jgi:hypothetical protein
VGAIRGMNPVTSICSPSAHAVRLSSSLDAAALRSGLRAEIDSVDYVAVFARASTGHFACARLPSPSGA